MGLKRPHKAVDSEGEEAHTYAPKRRFSMDAFRNGLQGDNPLAYVKAFVKRCHSQEQQPDAAIEYLEAGGGVQELLPLLSLGLDACHTPVFEAISILVTRTLTHMPQNRVATEEVCRYLLNSQLRAVHAMLSLEASERSKKVVLRFLTAMVNLSTALAREVLSQVNFSHPVVCSLARHPSVPQGGQSVRTCFVHFLLAFLVDGNMAAIRPLLEKKGLLTSIMWGLQYDDATLVVMVLSALRTKLLDNTSVTKTMKLHTFSSPVVLALLKLYCWKGPRPEGKKRSLKPEPLPQEEQDMVVEAVHEFMLILCTSHRHGIAFYDRSLGTSTQKCNRPVMTAIQNLQRPWEQKLPAELVVKALQACPELVRPVIHSMSEFLVPRASHSWLQSIDFLRQVFSGIDVEASLKLCNPPLTTSQLLYVLPALTVPATVMLQVGTEGLRHVHPLVRHETASLFCIMLRRLRAVMDSIELSGQLSQAGLCTLKRGIAHYLAKYLPDARVVWSAWEAAFSKSLPEETAKLPTVPEHSSCLAMLLDLLLIYCQLHVALSPPLEPQLLLAQLASLQEEDMGVQVKMLHLILAMDNTAITARSAEFPQVLLLLLELTWQSADKASRSILTTLLHGTGIFDGAGDELNLWLHCYQATPKDAVREVGHFVVTIVLHAATCPEAYHKLPACSEYSLSSDRHSLLKGLLTGWQDYGAASVHELSPLLACALHEVTEKPSKPVVQFVSHAVVHLLHSQPSPEVVLALAREWPDLPTPVAKYMSGWHLGVSPLILKKPFSSRSVERKLSQLLLQATQPSAEMLTIPTDPTHVMLLFNMTLFYVLQLALKGQLSKIICDRSKAIVRQLMSALQHAEGQTQEVTDRFGMQGTKKASYSVRCLRSALTHPILLHIFAPLYEDHEVEQRLVTDFTFELLQESCWENHGDGAVDLLVPFRHKFLTCVLQATKHLSKEQHASDTLATAASVLQLQPTDMKQLLDQVAALPCCAMAAAAGKLSSWGALLFFLLRAMTEPIPANTLKAIVSQVAGLAREPQATELANGLQQYLLRFPHSIAHVPPEMFSSILRASRLLAALLLECNPGLLPLFKAQLQKGSGMLNSPEELLPVVRAAMHHNKSDAILDAAFKQLQPSLEELVLQPCELPAWVPDHIDVIRSLVQCSAAAETCKRLSRALTSRVLELPAFDAHRLDVVESILRQGGADESLVASFFADQLEKALRDDATAAADWLCTRLQAGCGLGTDIFTQMLRCSMAPKGRPLVLAALARVLSQADGVSEPELESLFNLTMAHSEFFNVLLGLPSETKRTLVELLLVLARRCPRVLQPSHVPVLLGAYGATLSATDQLLLQLLQQYEWSGVNLHQYRPYLWGEAAVSHYSVRVKAGLALWRIPLASQVLDLLDMGRVMATIHGFPSERTLQATGSVYPDSPRVYDLAFLLPLLSHLLAPESVVCTQKVNKVGAVALVLIALSSDCTAMRAAAGHVLARYQAQLEAGRSTKEKKLLLHFLGAVKGGMLLLGGQQEGKGQIETVPQLAGVCATFLARASLVMSQPLHPMYAPLHTFMLAKPSLNLKVVPEMLTLLHSSHVDYRVHRFWLLEVLRYGLRNKEDSRLLLHSSSLFKLLMSLYSCVLVDHNTQVLILLVLESALKLPGMAKHLVANKGFLSWLHQCIAQLTTDTIEPVQSFMRMLSFLQATAPQQVLYLLLQLLPAIPPTIPAPCLDQYLHTLAAVQSEELPTKLQVQQLLSLCGQVLGPVDDCRRLLQYGCDFARPVSGSCVLKDIVVACLRGHSSASM